MGNAREDYRGPKAKITFNHVKQRRRGKHLLIGIGCLCIAITSGIVTAVLVSARVRQVGYYLMQQDNSANAFEKIAGLDDTVQRLSKSIVSIIDIDTSDDQLKESNVGVGIVIGDGHYIIANYDCIDNGNAIKVKLYDDIIRNATIVGFDNIYNIAMLKVEGDPLLPISFPEDLRQISNDDTVISMGNPTGNPFDEGVEIGKITNTRETIFLKNANTACGESLKVIKTNILPRTINAGAALCNLQGELIGVNSMSFYKDFAKSSFYISVEELQPITDGILDKQDSLIAYLGVYGEKAVSRNKEGIEGVYAKDVTKNGIGYNIGIRPTDIIVGLNDNAVSSIAEINKMIAEMSEGEKLKITVFRDGRYIDFELTIKKVAS